MPHTPALEPLVEKRGGVFVLKEAFRAKLNPAEKVSGPCPHGCGRRVLQRGGFCLCVRISCHESVLSPYHLSIRVIPSPHFLPACLPACR